MESGWNVWVWLVGVVSRRWEWVESMGVATGCGCKEVYRFPHTTYPLLLLYLLFFCSSIPTLCSFFKMFFRSIPTLCSFFKMFFIYIYYTIYIYTRMGRSSPEQSATTHSTHAAWLATWNTTRGKLLREHRERGKREEKSYTQWERWN